MRDEAFKSWNWQVQKGFLHIFTLSSVALSNSVNHFGEPRRVVWHWPRLYQFRQTSLPGRRMSACVNMSYNILQQPPCIAHYKVDILCSYKVGFRSPLYIPTMGDKAVFCARNMPLDLEDDFIRTLAFQFIPGWFPTRKRLNICLIYAAMHFIDRWFPSKNGHNMSHHPLYRNMSPRLFRANIFCWGCIHGKALYRVKLAP